MFSVSEVFFAGVAVGAVLGLTIGVLLAWAVLRGRDNRLILQHVIEMTGTVIALVDASSKRREPRRADEEKATP